METEGNGYRQVVEEANEPKAINGMPVRAHLERGGPWDTLPGDVRFFQERARRYIERADLFSEAARLRVKEVWLDGMYRRAYLDPYESQKGES